MSRFGLVFLVSAGCASSVDLELLLDPSVVTVGEVVRVTLEGKIDAPANSEAELSVAVEGADLAIPDVVFESVKATPTGAAEFIDEENAVNESQHAVMSLYDGATDVSVQWDLVCNTPGEWSVFGDVLLQTAGGAPMSPDIKINKALLICQ